MTPTNQKDAVLQYMQETGPIDFLIAANVIGVSQLTARIAELRREGWEFQKTTTKGRNRFGNAFVKTIYYNPRRVDGPSSGMRRVQEGLSGRDNQSVLLQPLQ